MNIEVNRINSGIAQNPTEYIRSTNEAYLWHITEIARNIAENREQKPVVLLSGPSGSGKTTTALMLAKILGETGCPTHTLSMDNYFKSLTDEERELSVLGRLDLESPDRVDKDLLNTQIEAIEKCRAVDIPKYDFAESRRNGIKMNFKRNEGELVIFEGIHALNPDVITVPESSICKLYVSVRTRIVCGDIILHPSKVRLMRRMIRDRNFRRRSLRETMNMFQSVESGENKYIMPYKHRSDYDIDTFMAYEMNVYRNSLLDELKTMGDVSELADVTEVLENLEALGSENITPDSLICEFIGGGMFKY
ncbi:MAG: nucleoside kinase [Ruminococcus flavefaciens]|nr:nucleoside kinase [Ruminococcus flavefaciens]MCM1229391.1 nucleoside kinase [Ruminococcus flavefaciens]